ncbi:MAG: ABC transporter permease [Candidatus Heimdallarchaeota archaeon]|nr:ABC transporter permease [Candidatus Heimdallarchaeota archaeon]
MDEKKNIQNKFVSITQNIGYEFRTTFKLSLKYLKEIFRSKLFFIIAILLPAILMIFMGVIFGGPISAVQSFSILVVNEDAGYTNDTITYTFGESLIGTLETITYPVEEGEEPMNLFYVKESEYYNQSVEDYLIYEEHVFHLTLIIPENFSEMIFSFDNDITVTVVGDSTTGDYQSAVTAFSSIYDDFVGAVRLSLGDTSGHTIIVEDFIDIVGNTTVFDLMVPGFVIIGIVMNVVFVSSILAEEYEQKTLEKLQLTPMRTIHLLGGLALAQLLVALVQIVVLFALSLAFGYNAIGSFVLAGIVIWIMSLSMSAIGMIIAAFAKKATIASSIASVVAIPLYMITFFPVWGMSTIPMFEINKNVFGVFDILPTNLATNMVNSVMIYGQTFSDIQFEFVSLIIVTLIYLIIGLVLISLLKLRPKKE